MLRSQGIVEDQMSPPGKPTQAAWKAAVMSRVDPQKTALLVIDLQNDFCRDDGAVAAFGGDVTPCRTIADRIDRFLPEVRGTVSFVAFFRLIYDSNKLSEAQRERLLKNGEPIICLPGSSGAELFVAPDPTDFVFTKHRYSAFSNEQFCRLLRERSITTVAVAGVDTHICVEGTVREGYDLGYRMVVLTDLVATTGSQFARHENSLALCERYFAVTISSNVFVEELAKQMTE
ncbi:MAG: cysteine hydrolase family protein [Pyrinomonadaceae bacterium]